MDIKALAGVLVERIRTTAPLIHNITNFVVMNSTANILLALGASPVMAHCLAEVEEMAGMADALVLNIGTLSEDWVTSMIAAGKTANARNIPVILDPVGSGATAFRTRSVKTLLNMVKISVLRGNASEILSLTDSDIKTRGVDASVGLDDTMGETFRELARDLKCIVGISGPKDFITDGRNSFTVANGHPLMTKVTGVGCGLSAVAGAFCAANAEDYLSATAAAFGVYGLCGDLAAKGSQGPGSFFPAFLDALYAIRDQDIQDGFRLAGAADS